MEGYTCHLNVVFFFSLHFGRTPSNQAWAKREKWKMLEILCNWGQCLCNTVRLLQRRKAVWQVGGKKGGDEKPQEQEKRMTSPFCHSCELAPLCFMEIGIDEDTRVTKNREHVRACSINKSWSQIDKNAPPPRLNSTDLSVLRMLCRTHSPALCSLLWSLNLFATWRGVNLSEATTAQNLLLTTVGLILALMEKLLFSYGEPKQRSFSNWRTCTMLDMRQQLLLNGESK